MNWLISLLGGYTVAEAQAALDEREKEWKTTYKQWSDKCAKLEQTLKARDAELHDLTVMLAKERDDLNELAGEKATLEMRCERLKEEIDVADRARDEAVQEAGRVANLLIEKNNRPSSFLAIHVDDSIKDRTGNARGPVSLGLVIVDDRGDELWHELRKLSYSKANVATLNKIVDNYREAIGATEPGADTSLTAVAGR